MKETKTEVAKIDKSKLSISEALSLLSIHLEGKKKRVHTFEGGVFLFGCDIDLSDLKSKLKETGYIGLSGGNMRNMGHGVAIEQDRGFLFLETDKVKLDAIFKKRNIK